MGYRLIAISLKLAIAFLSSSAICIKDIPKRCSLFSNNLLYYTALLLLSLLS